MDALISTDRLADRLGERGLAILDATMVAADTGRDPAAEFAAGHIPGARFLDLATLRDTADPLPNMLPAPEQVADRLRQLGVQAGDRIVLYDASPWRTAARAWFVLRNAGREAALLDGGLAKWRAEGLPVAPAEAGAGGYAARTSPDCPAAPASAAATDRIRTQAQVAAALAGRSAQVVDARSAARFTGAEADPHPGVAPGHMPGARNLPYARLFAPDGAWLRGEALAAAFRGAGIDPARPVIATCGSGVTAAVLLFGLHLLGHDGALYDGSWTEWGADPAAPSTTGAA